MKNVTSLASAAFIAVALLASPALSQTGADAAVAQAIASVGASEEAGSLVRRTTDASNVSIVDIESALTDENKAALDAAIAEKNAAVVELRNSVQANAALFEALKAQKLEAEDVVAATLDPDGRLVLYAK